jgi:hypothetical protein
VANHTHRVALGVGRARSPPESRRLKGWIKRSLVSIFIRAYLRRGGEQGPSRRKQHQQNNHPLNSHPRERLLQVFRHPREGFPMPPDGRLSSSGAPRAGLLSSAVTPPTGLLSSPGVPPAGRLSSTTTPRGAGPVSVPASAP